MLLSSVQLSWLCRNGAWLCCNGAWLCCNGAWLCCNGAWLCCNGAWLCCNGAWLCCNGAWLCCNGAWLCCNGAWLCCNGAWLCCNGSWLLFYTDVLEPLTHARKYFHYTIRMCTAKLQKAHKHTPIKIALTTSQPNSILTQLQHCSTHTLSCEESHINT